MAGDVELEAHRAHLVVRRGRKGASRGFLQAAGRALLAHAGPHLNAAGSPTHGRPSWVRPMPGFAAMPADHDLDAPAVPSLGGDAGADDPLRRPGVPGVANGPEAEIATPCASCRRPPAPRPGCCWPPGHCARRRMGSSASSCRPICCCLGWIRSPSASSPRPRCWDRPALTLAVGRRCGATRAARVPCWPRPCSWR